LSGEARDRTTKMLQKANELMSTGDISAARLFYQRAADAGLAEAALAMALTWDPNELGRWKVLGLKADAKEAQRWDERAKALGSGEADQKLKRLGSN
jgi:TPR repeat protein